jgi:hypothetical protein
MTERRARTIGLAVERAGLLAEQAGRVGARRWATRATRYWLAAQTADLRPGRRDGLLRASERCALRVLARRGG